MYTKEFRTAHTMFMLLRTHLVIYDRLLNTCSFLSCHWFAWILFDFISLFYWISSLYLFNTISLLPFWSFEWNVYSFGLFHLNCVIICTSQFTQYAKFGKTMKRLKEFRAVLKRTIKAVLNEQFYYFLCITIATTELGSLFFHSHNSNSTLHYRQYTHRLSTNDFCFHICFC